MTNEITERDTRQAKKVATMLTDLAKEWAELSPKSYAMMIDAITHDDILIIDHGPVPSASELLFFAGILNEYAGGAINCEVCNERFAPKRRGKNQRYCGECSRKARQADYVARKKGKYLPDEDVMDFISSFPPDTDEIDTWGEWVKASKIGGIDDRFVVARHGDDYEHGAWVKLVRGSQSAMIFGAGHMTFENRRGHG